MLSVWFLAVIVIPTAVVAVLVRSMSRRFDGILLIISGVASLGLALFAATAMHADAESGMMAFEMTKNSFNAGVLSPVFIVATLTVMRGIFKFFGE